MASRTITPRPEAVADYRARILAAYDAADRTATAEGLAWYSRAESTMSTMARVHGVSRETAAGVTAALSPRTPWARNLVIADAVLSAARHGESAPSVGTRANVAKAWAIANGADPDSILGGPKVTAFYANLTGDHDRVTVDVWAARAAGANPDRLTDRRRRELREAYRQAAESRGVTPRQLQAAVWVAVRGSAD